MAIFRVTKDKNYTVISNLYLKNKNLSLKAIGLFTIILSLPKDFNYSIDNLTKLTKESYRTIKLLLKELKDNGYLVISKKRNEKGLYDYEYIFFESNTINPTFNSLIVKTDYTGTYMTIPQVKNYPMDSDNDSNQYNNSSNNPEDKYPLLDGKSLYNINTNNYKIYIDITKLDLCFLTEELIKMDFIKWNDIDVFSYDYFLKDLLEKENYKDLICVVNYVAKKVIKSKFKDENFKPIINLLSYFKSAVLSNLKLLETKRDPHLFDDWFDE